MKSAQSKPQDQPEVLRGKMHRLINHLIQLQDLMYARDQQQASIPGSRLKQLDDAIRTLMEELPDDVQGHFERMSRKAPPALVPLTGNACSACGMVVPVSQVHAVHAADVLYRCANCARFVFYPDQAVRRISQKRRRGEPMQVGIARFSSPALMIPKLKANSRDEALEVMCAGMEQAGFIEDRKHLFEEVVRRETIMSTAVDPGIAFPHVRGVEGGGLALSLATLPKGVKFDEGSRTLTRVIFLIVIPTAASAFYLKLLSGLTQTFRDNDHRNALLEAETPEALWKGLIKATRSTIP